MMKKLFLLFVPMFACAMSPEKVVVKDKDKVVKLGMVLSDHRQGVCSGAFIDKEGDVLTCAHCVSDDKITKVFIKTDDGTVYVGAIGVVDKRLDLALVRPLWKDGDSPFVLENGQINLVIPQYNFPYFKIGKPLVRGQEVVLFGSPLGLQHTVSVGWVENFTDDIEGVPHGVVIQSAATNPGNSGGPLVDLSGRLVGVGEGTIMENPFEPAAGMGFAVGLEHIKDFLKQALTK
jgi:serine protease Do